MLPVTIVGPIDGDGSGNSIGYCVTLEMLPVTTDGDGSVGSDGYQLTLELLPVCKNSIGPASRPQ